MSMIPEMLPLKRPRISVPARQYERLTALAITASPTDRFVARFLTDELSRAHVIRPGGRTAHVVQIGSHVTYRDERSGQMREVRLAYPGDFSGECGRISVMTPIGTALLGLAAGQSISYPVPDGSISELTVLAVVNII